MRLREFRQQRRDFRQRRVKMRQMPRVPIRREAAQDLDARQRSMRSSGTPPTA